MIGGPRRAPRRSTIQPSIGVSQVSSAMKMEKANWISFRLQPWALCIGLTNSVQPYWRLAIRTMQATPSHNCDQRLACTVAAGAATVMTYPPLLFLLLAGFLQPVWVLPVETSRPHRGI